MTTATAIRGADRNIVLRHRHFRVPGSTLKFSIAIARVQTVCFAGPLRQLRRSENSGKLTRPHS
jgi:hypothetical protein